MPCQGTPRPTSCRQNFRTSAFFWPSLVRSSFCKERALGHTHLIKLPATRTWEQVVRLINEGEAAGEIASATAAAAEKSFVQLAQHHLYHEATEVCLTVLRAATSNAFVPTLRRSGLTVADRPMLLDVIAAVGRHLDQIDRRPGKRDDLGEITRRTLLSSLSDTISDRLPSLFATDSDDVVVAIKGLAQPRAFRDLMRRWLGQLVGDVLRYWLDRGLGPRTGAGERFKHAIDRTAFDDALVQYCSEATRIISEFSEGWYVRHVFKVEDVARSDVNAYAAVAMKKILSELQRKGIGHG